MTDLQEMYDEDVADCKKSLEAAEIEVKDAVAWHQKMLVRYAEAILLRDKNKI